MHGRSVLQQHRRPSISIYIKGERNASGFRLLGRHYCTRRRAPPWGGGGVCSQLTWRWGRTRSREALPKLCLSAYAGYWVAFPAVYSTAVVCFRHISTYRLLLGTHSPPTAPLSRPFSALIPVAWCFCYLKSISFVFCIFSYINRMGMPDHRRQGAVHRPHQSCTGGGYL